MRHHSRYLLNLRVALFILFTASALSGTAQTSVNQPSAATPSVERAGSTSSSGPRLQEHHPRYRLQKSDSFEVNFAFSPELNQTVSVQPDGFVTLRQVGTVYVEGQTVPELTDTLKAAYSKILHDPVIAISVKDFEKPYFIASGQVRKPGKYDLHTPLTVTQAVAIAGGFNDSAKHSQVVLFHPTGDGQFETRLLNTKQLLARRNLNEDIPLQPGDMIYVPQSEISKIRKFMPSSSVGAYYNPAIF